MPEEDPEYQGWTEVLAGIAEDDEAVIASTLELKEAKEQESARVIQSIRDLEAELGWTYPLQSSNNSPDSV